MLSLVMADGGDDSCARARCVCKRECCVALRCVGLLLLGLRRDGGVGPATDQLPAPGFCSWLRTSLEA